jgi:hypothetical protein
LDRPLIVKSNKCKEGLSFDLSHEDVVEQLLPMFEKEAYYEDGKVVGFTDFTSPYDENVEGLKWSLARMLEACDKEVLDLDNLNKEKQD